MRKINSLQAILDRARTSTDAPSVSDDTSETQSQKKSSNARHGTKLIGGHFLPEISTQLRIIAAEEGTTVQNLLKEALEDLFVKKGKKFM